LVGGVLLLDAPDDLRIVGPRERLVFIEHVGQRLAVAATHGCTFINHNS
jgi:hypothetical protein